MTLPAVELVESRRSFQNQELITARSGGWILQKGETPRLIWRDVDRIRELGADVRFSTRWFDEQLNEAPTPNHGGRWMAWLEGTAPNGTPFRRAFTFFVIPDNPDLVSAPDLKPAFPGFPGPNASPQWLEHQAEFVRMSNDLLIRGFIESERSAIFIAGVMESEVLGHPAAYYESATVRNQDLHLRLKLKLLNREDRAQSLSPVRRRDPPAMILRTGTPEEAGVPSDAADKIDAVCQAWASESQEPFVTLVAKDGVIMTHQAFGTDGTGANIDENYRCWVASLTKTVTAVMFSQFVDQGRVSFDDPISKVFPDFPSESTGWVPTFRQCMNHTSGLSGHGDFGGAANPHLDNIVLNGIDVNRPNSKYEYSGLGFEVVAEAMEYLSGKSYARVYSEHLFQPLEFGDVILGNASSDGEFTALELAKLAQWFLNEGSYGDLEFISPATFAEMMPRPVQVQDKGYTEDEGMGIHWVRHQRSEPLFGPRTFGHGSFSGCVFVIDPDQKLIITQVRRKTGPQHAEFSAKFFETIADAIQTVP